MDKYVEAMERKLDIAEYHLAVLKRLLPMAKVGWFRSGEDVSAKTR